MKNYFEGNATKDEALDLFYKAVEEKYPELTHYSWNCNLSN